MNARAVKALQIAGVVGVMGMFRQFDPRITDAGVLLQHRVNLMRLFSAPVILLATTVALGMPQSAFVGKWQTHTSRVTNKPAITVIIVELNQRLGGAVVLVNPDASEIKLPIVNLNIKENVMEFETRDKNDMFYWSLTLRRNPDRGLLHGSSGEMLVDEPVRKQPRTPQ
jgi:hypothetical protein